MASRAGRGGIYASAYSNSQTPRNPLSLPVSNMSGLFGGGAAAAAGASATQGDISKDVQVSDPPEDSISDLAFSPATDHLAVASWDKKVRIYEINAQGNSAGKAIFEHEAPVLSCAWSQVRDEEDARKKSLY